MKKRLITLLLGIVICFGAAIPAAAENTSDTLSKAVMIVRLNGDKIELYAVANEFDYCTYYYSDESGGFDADTDAVVAKNFNYDTGSSEAAEPDNPVEIGTVLAVTNGNGKAVDYWPKYVKVPENPAPVEVGSTVKLTSGLYNFMGWRNTLCDVDYDWQITEGDEDGLEFIPSHTVTGTSVQPDAEVSVKANKPGTYELTCTATLKHPYASGVTATVEGLSGHPNTVTITVNPKTLPDANVPKIDPNTGATVVGDDSLQLKLTDQNGTALKQGMQIELFFNGESYGTLTVGENGVITLTPDQVKAFIENNGAFEYRLLAYGEYGPSDRISADFKSKIDGGGDPITITGSIEATMGGDVYFTVTEPEDAIGPFEWKTVKLKSDNKTEAEVWNDWADLGKLDDGKYTFNLPNANGVSQSVNVYVRYKHQEGRLKFEGTATAPVLAMGGEEVKFVHKNGFITQVGSNWPNKPKTDGSGEDPDIYLVPKTSTMTFRLGANPGYMAKSAKVTSGDAKLEYDKDQNLYTLTVNGSCEVTATFRKPDGDTPFIPGTGESTGTTGSQTATGVTGNVWGSLLGGTGGTTAQSGAQTVGGFSDVSKSAYYAEAVLWAVNNNITNGTSATTFSPDASCTRAQMVTFLWRQAGSPEPGTTNNPFTDVKADQYYYKAVLWAVGKGITNGTSATTFSPNATVTRAQCVTFLWRNAGKPNAGTGKTFTDVTVGPYSDAINWAAARGITQGTSATTFSPSNPCTRAQIVTFMYRAL